MRNRKFRLFLIAGLSGILALSAYIFYLKVEISRKIEGKKWNFPSKVYSAPFGLYPGQAIDGAHLYSRMERLGYHPGRGSVTEKGEFRMQNDRLEIYLHDFAYPGESFRGFLLRLELEEGKIRRMVRADSGEELYFQELEPELIAGFFENSWEERTLIKLEDLPPALVRSVIAIEDERFFQHHGIDLRSILRAGLKNLRSQEIVQGGSTLTQQLVKNFFLDQRRTFSRKINEAIMAILIEQKYSKSQILEIYLNEIYWGQKGSVGIFGAGKAAQFYFEKNVSDLTVAESALLAGIIRAPNHLDPRKNLERVIERRNTVLRKLLDLKWISVEEYRRGIREKVHLRDTPEGGHAAPFFADLVRQQLLENYPPSLLDTEGLKIFTTLDVEMQKSADRQLKRNLERLEERYPQLKRKDSLQGLEGCLIAVSPHTGQVMALVGGRNYQANQFNRATQAHRQPGSIFKPIVYLTAFEQSGAGKGNFTLTASTELEDTPITLTLDDKNWSPQNYDQTFHGRVTVRRALENSLNVPTVKLALKIGLDQIIQTARDIGIESPLKATPSLSLGSYEVTPLEMITAYATVANQGIRPELQTVKQVVDREGRILERKNLVVRQAVTPQSAFLLTHLLRGVVENGTGKKVREMGFSRVAAGKTGTTNDYNDAWFVGYTPDLLTLVWVGFDQGEKLNLTGASAALPIWVDFMKEAVEAYPDSDFIPPAGIRLVKIVPATGRPWSSECGSDFIEEAFRSGTEPEEDCAGRKVPR